jgi:hypothetical protein
MAKQTGGGGAFLLSGFSLPFKTIEPSVAKEHDDSTDSTNYDITSGLSHLSQLAVSTQTTFAVEGVIDTAIIPAGLVGYLYTNPGSVPASIRYNTSTPYGHGNVDITEFKTTIAPLKTLTYSCTIITNGIFVPNS